MDADKKQVWLNGQFVEVTEDVYDAYMQGGRKIRYFESDLKVERTLYNADGTIKEIVPSREDSLDRLMDDNAEQFADDSESVEELALRNITYDALHMAMSQLTEDERRLIVALFFNGKTERKYAESLGVYRNAVHKRKMRILEKLKKLLE